MTHGKAHPLWVYKREPAGMGEWCYRIYRNGHYMVYAESESIAMIICNGLNRDEQSHTPAGQPEAQQHNVESIKKWIWDEYQSVECSDFRRLNELRDDLLASLKRYSGAIALLQEGRK